MTFPVVLHAGPFAITAHSIFESLGYTAGLGLFAWLRSRRNDPVAADRLWIVTAAIAGAAAGSKILYWLEDPARTFQHWSDPIYLMGGKTIVGALIGGWIAVEWIKRRLGIATRTGDLFALPLAAGTAVGRVGCFLSGLGDGTHGLATALPWGVDFGDGVPRHPVQIYEILWLALLATWIRRTSLGPHEEGGLFKSFMIGYLAFRLVVDFLKPGVPILGLTSIQWACAVCLAWLSIRDAAWISRRQAATS